MNHNTALTVKIGCNGIFNSHVLARNIHHFYSMKTPIPVVENKSTGKKALGGLKDVLHMMLNQGPMGQLESGDTMPNGYGTVRLPHLLWQPGSVMLLRLLVLAATGDNGKWDTHTNRNTRYIICVANRKKKMSSGCGVSLCNGLV